MKYSSVARIFGKRKTAKSPDQEQATRSKTGVLFKTGNYEQVPFYIILIVLWTAIVVSYVVVLEKAVRDPSYLGARGSKARNTDFDIIGFSRTALATIHVPLVVSVLASTIPYWTMTPVKDLGLATQPHVSGSHESKAQGSVIQLFYLADRNWAGLIGWLSTLYNTFTLACPSLLWLHLTVVVAFAYSGFPLLSLAYTTESLQYWDAESLAVPSSLGGSSISFDQAMKLVQDSTQWVGKGPFSAAPDHFLDLGDILVFNSSTKNSDAYAGLASNSSYWADGKSILTRRVVSTTEQFQMPVAAVKIEARCSLAHYNAGVLMSNYSIGPVAEIMFDFGDELACKQSCQTTASRQSVNCINNSSSLTMCSTDIEFFGTDSCFVGQALACGGITDDPSPQLGASANIQFAIRDPEDRTIVRTCEVSVSYVKPLANTLIGEYVGATADKSGVSSLQTAQGLTPLELVQISIAGPMNIFLNGPAPAAEGISPVTDGFKWVSYLYQQGAADLNPSAPVTVQLTGPAPTYACTPSPTKRELPERAATATETPSDVEIYFTGTPPTPVILSGTDLPTVQTVILPYTTLCLPMDVFDISGVPAQDNFPGGQNPWSLLQNNPTPTMEGVEYIIPLVDDSPDGNPLYIPAYLDENAFLKPLVHMITDPQFFTNGTTGGVVFRTDVKLEHGKVPWQLAIANLLLPLVWTFMLAILSNRKKRWTASLDAFAVFKLGGDWRGNLQDLRLASLKESKSMLESIPGTVQVDPDAGVAGLAHSEQLHAKYVLAHDGSQEWRTNPTTRKAGTEAEVTLLTENIFGRQSNA